jgi:hypothetical protein
MSDTPHERVPTGELHDWADWYRFARDELDYDHDERVEYANLRYVEDCNRERLRHARDGHAA